MPDVSFSTEQDYIVARDAALQVLRLAEQTGAIRVEWTFEEGGARGSKLEKIAFDIVSAIARSNVPVTGDIIDGIYGEMVDYKLIRQSQTA